jgi:hypothetical protein
VATHRAAAEILVMRIPAPARAAAVIGLAVATAATVLVLAARRDEATSPSREVSVREPRRFDRSQPLAAAPDDAPKTADAPNEAVPRNAMSAQATTPAAAARPARPTVPGGSAAVEQRREGRRPPSAIVASFDGLGVGFTGPQGEGPLRNPSDNSLAVGPDHIVQTVNSRMAIFTKRGRLFDTTGRVLFGAVPTHNVFRGFGGPCELKNNGDAVVRYDQLADRWLIVMPIFSRNPVRADEPPVPQPNSPAHLTLPGRPTQPGAAERLFEPPRAPAGAAAPAARPTARDSGSYSMCYALSTGDDPFGPYYRYEFVRPLFPDYPRPAVWPDGYYVPTSTGDDVIEKHACVVERAKMLRGEPAREICLILPDVNFLNNADLDGTTLPPAGAPNVMMATGGTQLRGDLEDDGVYVWNFHVDWARPADTRLVGPRKIRVAPYRYLCDGQLTRCVPQPGTDVRLDAQGDKLMARLVYRRIGDTESLVAVHSVNTSAGGGGVRWYEFRIGGDRHVALFQQGTYAPDRAFRWMASPAIDRAGNIGIGYSFGGTPHFAGQRFAARLRGDPRGTLSTREAVLAAGEAPQTSTLRWQDYSQTAIDPSDDCTIWYVGDYVKKGESAYSTRIGGFRIGTCR